MLKVGTRAPEFTLPDQDEGEISLSTLLNRGPLILYFYPADFTPGCTRQGVILPLAEIEENSRRMLAQQCAEYVAGGKEVPAASQSRLDFMNNAKASLTYNPAASAPSPAAMPRERKKSPPTVTGSFLTSATKAPAMSEAEARKLLLTEIAQRRGGAAAHRCRHMSVPQLASQLGSMKATPSRQAEIGKSWSRTFAKRGVETHAKKSGWDRAFARIGVATNRFTAIPADVRNRARQQGGAFNRVTCEAGHAFIRRYYVIGYQGYRSGRRK